VKKGGAGGKYTWGDLLAGAEAPAPPVLDHNDPNYGSSDDEAAPAGGQVAGSPGQSQNVLAFKQAVSFTAGHLSGLAAVRCARA
jgi:hypothetical protein